MKQDDWTQRLRDHLADYEAPVPDDLWEKIEARLPKEPVARKKAQRVPLWVRWAAAAMFAGAIVGTGFVLWPDSQEDTTTPIAVAQPATAPKQKTPATEEVPTESVKTLVAAPKKTMAPKKPDETIGIKAVEPEEDIAREENVSTEKNVAPQDETPDETIERIREELETIRKEQEAPTLLTEEIPVKSEEKDIKVNLYASNGFGNLSYRNGVLMSQELLANYDYYTNPNSHGTRSGGPVYLANHEERQKFYQPISFGLTVNVPISSGFSVSTGVVYTRLHSDFTSISNSLVYERQQWLHYIGIPLTVQYNVLQWHGLNVYAAAGGQADFNVKAFLNTDGVETKLEKDDVQWSVNAAVGVQYNFIPMLGIYAEPGVKHYFDNGSHIRNFFKYKPTNFNLQVGVRMNLYQK